MGSNMRKCNFDTKTIYNILDLVYNIWWFVLFVFDKRQLRQFHIGIKKRIKKRNRAEAVHLFLKRVCIHKPWACTYSDLAI